MSHIGWKITFGCLAILASGALLLSDARWLIAPSIIVVVGLLILLYGRTLYVSLCPSRFLLMQEHVIDRVSNLTTMKQGSSKGLELRSRNGVDVFQKVDVDTFMTELALSICANRGMYFWAYQLERYRQSSAAMLTLLVQYVLLLLCSIYLLTIANYGLISAWPDQFEFDGPSPSLAMMTLYSMSGLVLGGVSSVTASGDAAVLLRIVGGLCGPLLAIGVFMSVFTTHRLRRESDESKFFVSKLRDRARMQQEQLQTNFGVTVEEAIVQLGRLGYAFEFVIQAIVGQIPPEFFREDRD